MTAYDLDLSRLLVADAELLSAQGYAVVCNDGQAVCLIKEDF